MTALLLPVLAVADLAVAGWLLWSVPRQERNRWRVLLVAAVLIGAGGFLAVLAVDGGSSERPAQLPPTGEVT